MGKTLYKITFGEFAGAIGTISLINTNSELALFYPLPFSVNNSQIHNIVVHFKQIGRLEAEVYYD